MWERCAGSGGAAFTNLVESIEAAQRRRAQLALFLAILHTAGFASERQRGSARVALDVLFRPP